MNDERLISEKEFRHLLGDICRTTFWKFEQRRDFPRRINLPVAQGRKVWLLSEATNYIKKLAEI